MPALIELSADESEHLLRRATLGRVVVTTPDGPEVLPVNYAVDGRTIVVRIGADGILARHGAGDVLFEVDHVDEERWHGWSVVARGRAEVTEGVTRTDHRPLPRPWADGEREHELRLTWTTLTGRRIGAGWDLTTSMYSRRADR